MKPVARLVPLLAALFAVACSGAQPAGASAARVRTAREYFPLAANAAWSFDMAQVDRAGEPPGLVTMRVVRDDGAGGFYMQQGRGAPALYEYAGGGVTRNGEVILRDPVTAGERWRGRGGDGYVVAHTGLTRTVTAGTFRDVIEVVRTASDATLRDGTEFRETYYYAPGVGPIEGVVPVILAPGDVRQYRLTLRGYTLSGDL